MNLMGIKPITTPSTMLLQGNEVPFKLEFQILGTKKKKKLENYFQDTNHSKIKQFPWKYLIMKPFLLGICLMLKKAEPKGKVYEAEKHDQIV